MHGLVQSQAHQKAAVMLSNVKAEVAQGVPGAKERLAVAKVVYRKALQQYIDPHKVYRAW